MKTRWIGSVGAAAVLAVAAAPGTALAGGHSDGWAVAGAILGGVLLGQMSAPACAPVQTVVVPVACPQQVIYAQPAPVFVTQRPVYVVAPVSCGPRTTVVYTSSRWGGCAPRPCAPPMYAPRGHCAPRAVVVRRTSYGRRGR
ncbi:MAG: hypothetical protein KJ579_10920 [Verrucomicrobia bacterium]|nr:hypothetical protein [Verrucomicrobiota bacterium]